MIKAPGGRPVSRVACQFALSQAMNDLGTALELLRTRADQLEIEAFRSSSGSASQNVSLFYEVAIEKGRKVSLSSPVWINVQTAEVLENARTMVRIYDEFKKRPEFQLICPEEEAKTLFCSPIFDQPQASAPRCTVMHHVQTPT